MPPLRVLPPVHSPVTLAAIASGFGAMAGGVEHARAAVTAELRARFGCRDLLLTDSGTGALTLALRAGQQRASGPVALPAYCCYDVATAADGAGVPVVLYDLNPATLSPDLATLRKALEEGARTVVVAHLYGIPADLAAVRHLVSSYEALLVEDAAQGFGGAYGGRPLGSLGSLGVLSFGRGKGVTSGSGGALLANDDAGVSALSTVHHTLAPARTSALAPFTLLAQWLLARPSLYGIPAAFPFLGLGETVYRRPEKPRAMPPFALGVLRRTLGSADGEAASRQAHAKRLLAHMAAARELEAVQAPTASIPGYLRLPVLVSDAWRDRCRSDAAKRLGIMPGYPGALSDLPGFRARVRNCGTSFPGASRLVTSLVTLPVYAPLSERDLQALEGFMRGGAG